MPSPDQPRPFMHLRVGSRYRVEQAFSDYDGCVHPRGEVWTYLGHDFLPYVDGLTLHVRGDDERERAIRLQWLPEAQGAVVDRLEDYIRPADD